MFGTGHSAGQSNQVVGFAETIANQAVSGDFYFSAGSYLDFVHGGDSNFRTGSAETIDYRYGFEFFNTISYDYKYFGQHLAPLEKLYFHLILVISILTPSGTFSMELKNAE
jgi:hypothetical protein